MSPQGLPSVDFTTITLRDGYELEKPRTMFTSGFGSQSRGGFRLGVALRSVYGPRAKVALRHSF